MTQLVILDEAPRLHDNPLLEQVAATDVILLRLPTEQTRQAQLKRRLLPQFAATLRQLGFTVVEASVWSADDIFALASSLQCRQLLLAEPVAFNEQQLLASLQALPLDVSTCDVNGLLLDALRPDITTLPPSYSQFRRAREPQLHTSPVSEISVATPQPLSTGSAHASYPAASLHSFGPAEMLMHLLDEHWWLQQVERYMQGAMQHYKTSRNGLLGTDFASFLSTPLALGLLSIRYVYQQNLRTEALHGESPSSQWLRYELWWREYFRWVSRKEGRGLFIGLQRHATPPHVEPQRQQMHLRAWQLGRTGVPLVDANMQLLAQTGLLSNRGRQLVASYLVFDLGVDWRLGAAWFEQQLLDYDCASNYGNWAYLSGALYSPARWFNQLKQAYEYDRDGLFVAAVLGGAIAQKPVGMGRHQPYVADLGLPFDRRWYEYLTDANTGLV